MTRMAASEPETKANVPPDDGERRYIYNGEAAQPAIVDDFSRLGNRPIRKRHSSLLGRILLLAGVSLLIVFYVWNKISVNRLLVEVNDLQNQYQKLQTANDLLRAEINRKASLERVVTIAGKIGLVYPKQQPVWFEVPPGDLEKYQQQ
jgi:cell division protein FtsL